MLMDRSLARRSRSIFDVRVIAVCATAILAALLFLGQRAMEPKVEFSPLYRTTLEKTYSRFREADVRIPAGRTTKAVDPGLDLAEPRPGAVKDRESEEYLAAEKLEKAGDLPGTLAALRAALVKFPRSIVVRHRIGDVLERSGEWKEAINAYREILQRDASQLCCYEHMADIFRVHDQPEMAERMLQNAIGGYRLWLQANGITAQRGMNDLASLYLRQKRAPEEALELAKALVKDARSDASLFLLARCLANAGKRDEALEVVAQLAPTDPPSIRIVDEFKASLSAREAPASR